MWRLLSEDEGLWRKMVLEKYGIEDLDRFIHEIVVSEGSQWWNDLILTCGVGGESRSWFQNRVERVLWNEKHVSFGYTSWGGQECFFKKI